MISPTYAYYPGCALHTTAKEYDVSTRLACQALGIGLEELKDWTCCGASSAHLTNSLLAIALPAKELQLAEERGLPVVVACAMCFSRLKLAAHELSHKAINDAVGGILGKQIDHVPQVVHLLQVVESKKADLAVKKPLTGLKVACYYGCLLVRPKDVVGFDNQENPQKMDNLMQALGAETIQWNFKTECCGASFVMARSDIMLKLSRRILSQAKQAGADCVTVACPLCHSNLDSRQKEMSARFADKVGLPVFYFTQLLGIALGLSPRELLVDKHFTNPLPLLREKGLA